MKVGSYLASVPFCLAGAWPELHKERHHSAWTDSYADSRKARVLVTASRSRDHELLAVGDSEGAVQLFRWGSWGQSRVAGVRPGSRESDLGYEGQN